MIPTSNIGTNSSFHSITVPYTNNGFTSWFTVAVPTAPQQTPNTNNLNTNLVINQVKASIPKK